MTKEIYVDGACSGNPGKSRIAVYSDDFDLRIVNDVGEGTNNIAEYRALIYALAIAQHLEDDIVIKSDSKLVVEQVNGNWKVKNSTLRGLCEDARILINARMRVPQAFTQLVFIHREHNHADKLFH